MAQNNLKGDRFPETDFSFSITNSGTFTVGGDIIHTVNPIGPSMTSRVSRPSVHQNTEHRYLVYIALRQYKTPEIAGPDFWNLDEYAADRVWSTLAEHEFKRKHNVYYNRLDTFHLFM